MRHAPTEDKMTPLLMSLTYRRYRDCDYEDKVKTGHVGFVKIEEGSAAALRGCTISIRNRIPDSVESLIKTKSYEEALRFVQAWRPSSYRMTIPVTRISSIYPKYGGTVIQLLDKDSDDYLRVCINESYKDVIRKFNTNEVISFFLVYKYSV